MKSIFLAVLFVLSSLLFHTSSAHAATFDISGWIPYWRSATGTQEALLHLNTLTEINPFGYTVKKDGRLNDTLGIDAEPWTSFFAVARARKIKIIPSITWSDSAAMDVVLSNPILRDAQIADIVEMVKTHNFDGVDIDFENKLVDDRTSFAVFLKDLYKAMGNKLVECDIEPRTPIASRYDTIPKDFSVATYYANDFSAVNSYCDRVRIMAYDQRTVDLKLDQANVGPYSPVADPQWVKKVVDLAAQTISKKKLVLGIPTYGYEYRVTPNITGTGFSYKLLWAFNPKYATDLAAGKNVTPQRNSAGELSFIYSTGTETRLLWWSDARAIQDKVNLAHEEGLKGVALFKIDGGADPNMWSVLH